MTTQTKEKYTAEFKVVTLNLGLTVQNFLSAARCMAVLVALVRGFIRRNSDGIGNFWVDMTRSTNF